MRLTPRHLQAVLAVAEHGTFSSAAEALGLSQPALSKNIALLEDRIGAAVLERGPRGSTLTEVGRIIARRAHNLELLLSGVQEEIRAHNQGFVGPLKVGATPNVMVGLVPEAIARTAHEQPNISASITAGLDDVLIPALRQGDIDLLVGAIEDTPPLPADLTQFKLVDESFLIAVSPTHRLAEFGEIGIEELQDEAWVLPTRGTSFHRILEAMFIAAGMNWPQKAISTNSVAAQDRLVSGANRIAFVSRVELVGRQLDYRTIALKRAPLRALGVKQRKDVQLSPSADVFLKHLRKVAHEMNLKG